MKKQVRFLAFALFAFFCSYQGFGQGGPDQYGYTWLETGNSGGPAYNWVDIVGRTGTVNVTGLADDNAVGPFAIGFNFQYYWIAYTDVKLGSNGWLSFDNVGNIASCFPNLPTPGGAGDNILAPLMSDLSFVTDYPAFPNVGEMYYWTNNTDSFVVTYENVPFWNNANGGANPPDWAGSNTFQMILNGADSTITYQYQATSPNDYWDSQNCPDDVIIGIENVTGNIGLQHSTNAVPGASHAIRFYPPVTPGITIADATPAWNANSDNQGQFFLVGETTSLTANIANVGNGDITNPISAIGKLESLSFSALWRDTVEIASLVSGADQTITYPSAVNLSTAGQYYYTVTTSTGGGQDQNPSNNSNITEISAVDCANDTMSLTYATGNPPDGSINWGGGGNNSGVGIFIDPPVYPSTINSVTLFLFGDDADPTTPMLVGCDVFIYEEDVNGAPGNVLWSTTLAPGDIAEDAWNEVAVTTPITITQGGFYIAWIQGGTGIGIGTENFGPISQRTYEILAGGWAPYRLATATDFLIKTNVSASCAVGIDPASELAGMSLLAYPNPAGDQTTLSFDLPAQSQPQITVSDLVGRVQFEKQYPMLTEGKYELPMNTADWAPGVYVISLQNKGHLLTRKLVIQ